MNGTFDPDTLRVLQSISHSPLVGFDAAEVSPALCALGSAVRRGVTTDIMPEKTVFRLVETDEPGTC